MYKLKNRLLALALSLIMLISCVPATSEGSLSEDSYEIEILETEIIEEADDSSADEEPVITMPETIKAPEAVTNADTVDPVVTDSESDEQPDADVVDAEPADVPEVVPDAETSEGSESEDGSDTVEPEVSEETLAMREAEIDAYTADIIAAMRAESVTGTYEQAEWLYSALISGTAHGNESGAYAALIGGSANSEGYAEAYARLLKAAGINTMVVRTPDGTAAWNIICVNGSWTHVDAYRDDASGELGRHFGLTDAAMAMDREWITDDLPACNDASLNYYVRHFNYTVLTSDTDISSLFGREKVINVYNAAAVTLDEIRSAYDLTNYTIDQNACYITFTAADMDEKEAMIEKATASITVATTSFTLGVGDTRKIVYTTVPSTAKATFYTSSSSVCTVDASGIITGRKTGTATITVAIDGATATIKVTVVAGPTGITATSSRFNSTAKSIIVGKDETVSIDYSTVPASAKSYAGVTYSSANLKVASVTSDGKVTGVATGKTTITLSCYNGISTKIDVTVVAGPSDIAIVNPIVSLGVGETAVCQAILAGDPYGIFVPTYSSSNTSIVAVNSSTGKMTANAEGSAIITAKTYNGKSNTCSVTVSKAPESISISGSFTTIAVGEQLKLNAVLQPEGSAGTISWISSDSKIATVSNDGTVVGKAPGTVTITAKAYNGVSKTYSVVVKKAVSKVTVNLPSLRIGIGETMQAGYTLVDFTNYISYISSNPNAASIDDKGLITGHSVGSTAINVKAGNIYGTNVILEVMEAPDSVKASAEQITIPLGDTAKISGILPENTASMITYASDETGIASVAANGTITATGIGETFITLETFNKKTATCKVIVTDAPTAVSLRAVQTTMGIGQTQKLSSVLTPADTTCHMTYTSSNSTVLTVDANGTVKAKAAGSATITVKTYNNLTAKATFTVKKAPTSVSFSVSRATIGVGETVSTSYSFPSGTAGSIQRYEITYPTTDAPIKFNENGSITALSTGSAKVRCVSYNGKNSAEIKITVAEAPSSIEPASEKFTIGMGMTGTVGYRVNAGAAGGATFSVEDTSVCTVNTYTGAITPKAVGTTKVTITSYNKLSCTCEVVVVPAPSSVSFSGNRTAIGLKESIQLVPKLSPAGSMASYKFSSSKSSVVSVNANGVITGKKKGSATITVKTHNGKTAKIKITVKKAPKSIKLNVSRTVLGVGEAVGTWVTFPAKTAGHASKYSSTNGAIAKIDAGGTLRAYAPGTVSLNATSYNGKVSKAVKVTVKKAPTSIAPAYTNLSMGQGSTGTLKYVMPADCAGSVTYTSSNPSIATVGYTNGLITAKAVGTCTITLKTYNGLTADCELTVTPAPTSIKIVADKTSIGVNEKIKLNVQYQPSNATGTVTYSTNKAGKSIASVSSNGYVTGKKTGTLTVTAKTYNGKTATIKITVKKAPGSVSLTQKDFKIGNGETFNLKPYVTIPSGTSASFQFTSYNPDICTVNSNGVLTGVAVGTATIKVSTHNGKSVTCTVRVLNAPTDIKISVPTTVIAEGQKTKASYAISSEYGETTCTKVYYSIVEGNCATVAADGTITGTAEGFATVRVATYDPEVYDDVVIEVKKAPKSLSLDFSEYSFNVGETLKVVPIIDADSLTEFSYTAAKSGYLGIEDHGDYAVIKAVSRGTTTFTVKTHNGLSASITITVIDPSFPEQMAWAVVDNNPPLYMSATGADGYLAQWKPQVTVSPSTAVADVTWASSDSSILAYDSASGMFKAKSYGTVTVTGKSTRNPSLTVSAKITVAIDSARITVLPFEYTSISGKSSSQISTLVSENQSRINNVKNSAYAEIATLQSAGTINSTEASKRKTIVNRAFDMLNLPWYTSSQVAYWTSSYDAKPYNHSKDYKTSTLYFGIPYTQTYREFNKTKLINNSWFTGPTSGMYKMNTSKFSGRNYRGNDCSSFVSQAVLAGSNYDNTTKIASSSSYTTLDKTANATKMRPGDILVNSGHHVVMFLYYTNTARTQFMIIEQGGSDDYHTNVVACRIKTMSNYSKYTLRRPKL